MSNIQTGSGILAENKLFGIGLNKFTALSMTLMSNRFKIIGHVDLVIL